MMKFNTIEHYLQSKTNKVDDCEDFIYIGDNFIAVIDGATSKMNTSWDNESPGKIAGRLIKQTFNHLPANATAREAVNVMTERVHDFYRMKHLSGKIRNDAVKKVTASFAALSLTRKEIWLVGDCQALTNNKLLHFQTTLDRLLSEIRAVYIETELLLGKTMGQLLKKDTGREFILPILMRQALFQNAPQNPYWYPVIDGFPVPDEGIVIEPITTDTHFVVLATDGYINLQNTLADSEIELLSLLTDDPLLFRLYKSTKGKLTGQASFDDRAYVRVSIDT